MERYFQLSFHALLLTAFIALAETGQLDVPTIVIFLVLFGLLTHRTLRSRPPVLSERAASILAFGYIFLFVIDATVLSRSFISAVVHLVLFLELAKLSQKKNDKDYLYLMVLAFLQVLAAASLTIDTSFVVTLVLFLVALVSTLMSFDIYRSQRRSDSPKVAMGFTLGGMSIWVTLWILLVGFGLFFVIPRVGTGYFTRAASEGLLLSGFTESVELGTIGQVKLSSALVMRMRLLEGVPLAAPKWRGIVLDTFDGHTWYKATGQRSIVRRVQDIEYMVTPAGGDGDTVRFEVFLEPLATTTLFGLHRIRTITGEFRGLERDGANSVYQRTPTNRRIHYEVVSDIPGLDPVEPGDSRNASPAEGEIGVPRTYLQVPDGLDPRITELAETVTERGETVVEKASLLEAYLKRNYTYSLDLSWDPGDEPLSTFLFQSRAGHCEYFASSMAIMLRAVGIPTRMVNGFLTGEFNSIGGSYIVRQSDAHSWVEVYVPGRGWVEFDPTPPNPTGGELNMAVLISHYLDAAELFWNSYMLTYDSGTQLQLFRNAQESVQNLRVVLREQLDSLTSRVRASSDRFSARLDAIIGELWFWCSVLLFVLVGLVLKHRSGVRIHWKLWAARFRFGNADIDVVSALFYRAASLTAARADRRLPHQTWREWVESVPDEGRRHLMAVALDVFEKARYSDRPISTEEFSELEQTVRELRTAA